VSDYILRDDAPRRIAALCALAGSLALLHAGHAHGQIADVTCALQNIVADAKPLTFNRGELDAPPGGHLQGIQMRFDAARNRHLAFLSHDSATVAYLLIVAFPADLAGTGQIVHLHTFPGDAQSPPLRHAGGIQLLDNVLVVGLEDNQQKTRSEIQFWDVAAPDKLVRLDHLTIRRAGEAKDKTAGAVGIVQRAKDHLLAVANWDSRAIDFYASNGKALADGACRFAFHVRWQDASAEKSAWRPDAVFGAYQAVNLVSDADGKLFLIGLHTARDKDFVDLFALDMNQKPEQLLQKLAAKPMRLEPGGHFRYAGGISLVEGRPAILSSPSHLGDATTLSIAR
jgi:hypothetical protein